jgi:signal transduction histidine kinase
MNFEAHSQPNATSPVRIAVAVVLVVSIFVADTATNLEIAIAVFYIAVVLLSLHLFQTRGVVLISAGCMVLTLLSYFLTPAGSPQSGIINCVISLLAIGIATYLAFKIKWAEVSVHEARAQLAHIARVTTLGELTAAIAHEINQPLAAVITSGNACLRWLAIQPPNLEKARQAVDRIVKDANRASAVIGRVRSLAKRDPPQRDWLDINELILEIVGLTRYEIEQNHIILRTQLAANLPPVLGDRIQLQQVLLNLISNAIEALSPVRDGPLELLLSSVVHAPNTVLVAVHDSGIGVDPDKSEHVFDAFYTTKRGGMGIGLAISRSIIEAHGGKVWVVPKLPRGAIFQFSLPIGESPMP